MTYTKNANCWVLIAVESSRKTLMYNLNHELNNIYWPNDGKATSIYPEEVESSS